MKKLLLFVAVLILSVNSYSQIFITVNPMQGHFNPGIVGAVQIDNRVGVYANVLYGDIRYTDYVGEFYGEQFKYGGGFTFTVTKLEDVKVLFGLSNSIFRNIKNTTTTIDMDKYIYNSINLGLIFTLPISRKINILFLTDVNNWESQIGINISLKRN